MLPGDSLSLSQIAATRAILPVGDPRQQALQRGLAGQLGQTLQAEVLSRLDDGSFVVRVNDMAARMPLPAGAEVGQQVPLTLVALNPRPTFQIETGKGAAFAEAGPAPQEGAHAQGAPLAFLEGKDAAALTRTSALVAQTRAMAQVQAGSADDPNTSISRTGKLLGEVIAAAQQSDTHATAATGRTPLLAAPNPDPTQIASALHDGVDKSGLFYESHVAEWAKGARSLGDLAAEPQAHGMPAPTDPNTAQMINLQLNTQEQARVAWQGQLWPGQEMHWEIERKDDDASARQGGASGDDTAAHWQSRLRLRFASLGEVNAQLVLSGGQLHIRLDAADAGTGALLQAGQARLADALGAAGTPLTTLAIHAAPAGSDE